MDPYDGTDVLGHALLWVFEKPSLQRFITERKLTRPLARRFVAGEELEDAIAALRDLNARSLGGILNLLGEGVTTPAGADAAASDYLAAIKRIDETKLDTTVSVKLTQLGLAFNKEACMDHLRRLAAEAEAVGTTVEIDMEQYAYVSDTLDVYRLLHADFPRLRVAIQAYLRRSPLDLETMRDLGPTVRLVKGAYAEPVEVALSKRKEIDRQYAFLTDWLFDYGTNPALATHDQRLLDHIKETAARHGIGRDGFEIQMLHGVRGNLQEDLCRDGYRVRTYIPYGSHWYPYLIRRLAERPANMRFFLRAVTSPSSR